MNPNISQEKGACQQGSFEEGRMGIGRYGETFG